MDPYVQTDAFKTPVRVIRGIAPVVGVAGVSSVHWYQMTNDYEMTSSDDIHPIIFNDSYVSYLALKYLLPELRQHTTNIHKVTTNATEK